MYVHSVNASKKKVNKKTESQLQSSQEERSQQTLWDFKSLYSGKSSPIVVYRNYLTNKAINDISN